MTEYLKKCSFPLALLFVLCTGLLVSCGEADIKLINQIKTFGPQWASLGVKLDWLDRNLDLCENSFEQNYSEISPLFSQVPDSLRGRSFNQLVADYKEIVEIRDSLREMYVSTKEQYISTVESFNTWEKDVMQGEIKTAIGYADLTKFKQEFGDMETALDKAKAELESIAVTHNRVFRELTSRLEIPTNYDIALK